MDEWPSWMCGAKCMAWNCRQVLWKEDKDRERRCVKIKVRKSFAANVALLLAVCCCSLRAIAAFVSAKMSRSSKSVWTLSCRVELGESNLLLLLCGRLQCPGVLLYVCRWNDHVKWTDVMHRWGKRSPFKFSKSHQGRKQDEEVISPLCFKTRHLWPQQSLEQTRMSASVFSHQTQSWAHGKRSHSHIQQPHCLHL